MSIIPPFVHIVETVINSGANVTLSVTNSLNISDRDFFAFRCPVTIRDNITGSPLPVSVNVNGVAVPLLNRFGLQVLSDRVPKRAFGNYIVKTTTTSDATTQEPYVILLDTPRLVQNA